MRVEGGPPLERVAEALNAVLPADVAVRTGERADRGFHARFSARSRSYRYRIWRSRLRSPLEHRRALWEPRPLDEQALAACARLLLGEHDFRAFTPAQTQHTSFARVVQEARWEREGEALCFVVTADSFLRHMVRTLVGTMLLVEPEQLGQLLEGGTREQAGTTAPPWGLYLEHVTY